MCGAADLTKAAEQEFISRMGLIREAADYITQLFIHLSVHNL